MSIPEEYVPTDDELSSDHWSKSPEWKAYRAKQAELEAQKPKVLGTLPAHMQVGTIKTEQRKMSTHDIQMASCKVEWVDPKPVEELTPAAIIQTALAKHEKVTDEILADIAKTILERINKATDTAVEEDVKAG